MTGETREDMDTHSSERLPPIVTARAISVSTDTALSGRWLPPYRPGLYTGLLAAAAPQSPAMSEAPAPVAERTEQTVAEGWPESWRSDPQPSADVLDWHEPEPLEPEDLPLADMLVLDEGDEEPEPSVTDTFDTEPDTFDTEPDTFDTEPDTFDAEPESAVTHAFDAEPETAAWASPLLDQDDADARPWASWDEDEDDAAVYDLPGAAAEDLSPWQDSWGEPASPADALSDEAAGPVNTWTAEPTVETAGEGEETGDVIETVEEIGFGATLEFAPADEHVGEAPSDSAWAPFDDREPPAYEAAGHVADEAAAEVVPETPPSEPADERVAIVPPTPLDSWYHGQQTEEAEATWEAFGRALEEAASWGDLDTTIATGLSPEEARSRTPEDSATPAGADVAVEAVAPVASVEPATEPDPAVTDLAQRLEMLARRLREEGEKGVASAMIEGDRLEASLAGFIAGYVAARRG